MNIVFYDTETSGLDDKVHDIIQIAAAAFEINGDDWKLVESFECKMWFDMAKVDPKALLMNCFSVDTWKAEAVTQQEGIAAFNKFASKYKDVKRKAKKSGNTFYCLRTGGHNILKFDDPFVRAWYKREGKFCPFDYGEVYDTMQLAKWKLGFGAQDAPENYKLEDLCALCNVKLTDAHDALADIMANARLAWRLTRETTDE